MNIKDDFILKNIHKGYLVGGYIREFLIKGEFSKDRDIAVKGAEKFAKDLSKTLDATFIILDSENKIYRLVLKDKENYLDISELRGEKIEEDLLERDFTINAIAYDLSTDNFIDPLDGISDIKNKKIKHIREKNFADDPLRVLRAYRFMAITGFDFDNKLTDIIKNYFPLINIPAKERIHDEILKLFGGNYTSKTLIKMYNDGFLELIFPFVSEIKKVPPNSHHHLDLIHHIIETVKQTELLYNKSDSTIKNHLSRIDFGAFQRINYLKLSCFLHDIGKPSTWTIEENGTRHRFLKHDIKGSELVKPILKDLKFSNKEIEYISEMIRKHIYPSNVISASDVDNKIMMRYIRKMGNNVIDNIILAKSDRLSALGPDITKEIIEANINGLNRLLNFYIEIKDTLKPLPKLIDGNEIMNILNINQSKILGKIINEIKEEQLNGNILTKEDAIKFVKNYKLV